MLQQSPEDSQDEEPMDEEAESTIAIAVANLHDLLEWYVHKVATATKKFEPYVDDEGSEENEISDISLSDDYLKTFNDFLIA